MGFGMSPKRLGNRQGVMTLPRPPPTHNHTNLINFDGFTFTYRDGHFDWRLAHGIDLDAVVRMHGSSASPCEHAWRDHHCVHVTGRQPPRPAQQSSGVQGVHDVRPLPSTRSARFPARSADFLLTASPGAVSPHMHPTSSPAWAPLFPAITCAHALRASADPPDRCARD